VSKGLCCFGRICWYYPFGVKGLSFRFGVRFVDSFAFRVGFAKSWFLLSLSSDNEKSVKYEVSTREYRANNNNMNMNNFLHTFTRFLVSIPPSTLILLFGSVDETDLSISARLLERKLDLSFLISLDMDFFTLLLILLEPAVPTFLLSCRIVSKYLCSQASDDVILSEMSYCKV
jgi:hypothetical protein